MKEFVFDILGIRCEGCAKKIKENLNNDDLVDVVSVSVEQGKVTVSGKDALSGINLKKDIETLGFSVQSFKKVTQ